MRGSKPTPTVVRLLQNPRAAATLEPDLFIPEHPVKADTPPSHFTTQQQRIWRETIEDAPVGLLKRLDVGALTAYVMAVDTHIEASKEVSKGLVVKTAKGGLMQSPYVAIMNRTALIIAKLAEELGLSATSRARIKGAGTEGGKKANPFAEHAASGNRA